MKLNKQQTYVLAEKIVKEIKEKAKKCKFTKENERELKADIGAIQVVYKKWREAEIAYNKATDAMQKKHKVYYYEHDGIEKTIKNAKTNVESQYTTPIPTRHEVENEIVLESVFSDEKDVQKFIDKLVKKYL